jgi:hypothetical protein
MAAEIGNDQEQVIDDSSEEIDDDKPLSSLSSKLLAAGNISKSHCQNSATRNRNFEIQK